MAGRSARNSAIAGVSKRLPVLRRLPVLKLLTVAELASVARRHLRQLTPAERRRLGQLVRKGPKLSARERKELHKLVDKLDPRAFAGSAAERLSPLPLPRRLTKARY
jgi:hypothetical protein